MLAIFLWPIGGAPRSKEYKDERVRNEQNPRTAASGFGRCDASCCAHLRGRAGDPRGHVYQHSGLSVSLLTTSGGGAALLLARAQSPGEIALAPGGAQL